MTSPAAPATPGALAVARRWAANEAALCLSITQGRAFDIPPMAAACGVDSVYVDLEHTATDLHDTAVLCSTAIGAGLMPLVRVAHANEAMTRVLDTGAMGLIVPHIRTPDQAAEVVRQCRFPPLGQRSLVGSNRATGYRPISMQEAIEAHDAQTLLAVMIESEAAVASVDSIAAVQGIGMLVLGPYDLSSDFGAPGRVDHPAVRQAMSRLVDACKANGKIAGIAGIRDEALIGYLVHSGYRFVSIGTDVGLFMEAARAQVDRIRAGITTGADQS